VRSPVAASGWLEPLHDAPPVGEEDGDGNEKTVYQPRQQPRALPSGEAGYAADYDATAHRLTLTLPLVHARYHLPPALRGLWRDADEQIALDLGAGRTPTFKIGDLPDLHLIYQVYLCTNPVESKGSTRVFEPILQVVGPRSTTQAIRNEKESSDEAEKAAQLARNAADAVSAAKVAAQEARAARAAAAAAAAAAVEAEPENEKLVAQATTAKETADSFDQDASKKREAAERAATEAAKAERGVDLLLGFQAHAQAPGVTIIREAGKLISVPSGGVALELTLDLTDKRCASLVAALRAQAANDSPIVELLAVAVQRRGVWSEFCFLNAEEKTDG
jgi:hypothetical protein